MYNPWNDDDDSSDMWNDGPFDGGCPPTNVNGLPMIEDAWVDITGHPFGDTGGTDLHSFDDDPYGC